MAQVVGWFENDVKFTEGPFVIVNANGWRIEVELVGHHCPVLPSISVIKIAKRLGLHGKTYNKELAAVVCDSLNTKVQAGEIILHNDCWVDRTSVIRAQEAAKRILERVE